MRLTVRMPFRVVQPSLLAWQYGDQRPADLILPWLDNYVAASYTEERGKPRGVLPSALSWPSGKVGGWLTNSWDNPGCHYDLGTYAWPRFVETLMKAMLLAYHKTQDIKYLDPILAAAEQFKHGNKGREQSSSDHILK